MEFLQNTDKSTLLLQGCVIGLWLYWLWNRRHLYRFALNFPGLLGLPYFGVVFRIMNLKYLYSSFEKFFRSCKSYTICMWLFLNPIVLTAEPDFIAKVLTSTELLTKSEILYLPLANFFGDGIAFSSGNKWHNNRKLIGPFFSNKVVVSFLPIFQKSKKLALVKLDSLVGKGELMLSGVIQRIILGIGLETTMGKNLQTEDELNEKLFEKYDFARGAINIHILLKFLKVAGIYGVYRKYIEYRKFVRSSIAMLATNRLDVLKNSKENKNIEACENSQLSRNKIDTNFINQAVQLYLDGLLTWQDVLDESGTVVAASIETTATTLYATLVMLATHPEIQQKLYEEVREVFPEKDFEMSYEHLEQLPYLERVINETLRLCPPIPIIGRQVVKDTQLTKDILLPKGLQVLISIFNLHRRLDIWGPHAEQFNPDNFLPENIANKHTFAYVPFSKGQRGCIGYRYAYYVLKALLAGFVRNYRFTTTTKYADLKYSMKMSFIFLNEPGIEICRR